VPTQLRAEQFQPQWRQLASLDRLQAMSANGRDNSAIYQVARALEQLGQPGDAIAFRSQEARASFSQYYRGTLPYVDPTTDAVLSPYQRIWGVLWSGTEDAERTLAEHTFPTTFQWYQNVRVRLYGVAPDPPSQPRTDQLWDLATLTSSSVLPSNLHQGDLLAVQLTWRVRQATTVSYQIFVHVTGDNGILVAQTDDEPVAGLNPSYQWHQGETVTTRLGLWIPPDLKPNGYHVVVGLYDLATGQRLPAFGPDGARYANDAVPIGEVMVKEP
jgi:hypothetical protein